MSSISDPLLGEVTLVESKRARRVSISVNDSGEVRLTYPTNISATKALELLATRREWVLRARERIKVRLSQRDGEEIKVDIGELRRRAATHLPQRLSALAAETGLRYSRLRISSATTRWGSCSSAGCISLSLYIMMLPPHLIDLIIIHELCHTVEMNHSPRFHALVNHHTAGRERELERELKKYRIPKPR